MPSSENTNTFYDQLSSVLSFMKIPLIASSGLAAVVSGLLYFKQNEIIYPRNLPAGARETVPRPSQFGITDFEDLTIPTPDGESLNAFFIRPPNRRLGRNITLIMFHGNAGNIGHRVPIARVLQEHLACNILMVEYRGYGLSTGTPDEAGLMIDAQTGLDYVRHRAETRDSKIVIYGQSLGGAVGIQLVAKNQEKDKIAALILENTFLSMRKLIPSVLPPARYIARLCHQVWASEAVLPSIGNVPMLFLSGLKDEIVPPSHMKELFDICQSKTKVWRPLPEGCHNDSVMAEGYFEYIVEFVKDNVSA